MSSAATFMGRVTIVQSGSTCIPKLAAFAAPACSQPRMRPGFFLAKLWAPGVGYSAGKDIQNQ